MHLDIDGTGGAFMTSLQQLKRFEARISLFKSLDCPLALAAAGRNQRFTRYPPVINPGLGSIQFRNWNCRSIPIPELELELELKLVELKMELELKTLELELELKTGIEFFATATTALTC